jgi:hypothetical protein
MFSQRSAPMNRKRKPYRTYTKELKLEALGLMEEHNHGHPIIRRVVAVHVRIRLRSTYTMHAANAFSSSRGG